MNAPQESDRTVVLINLAGDAVKGLLAGAVDLGVEDGEMSEFWAMLTTAVLTLGASMEGAEWMERVVRSAVDAAKHDFDRERSKEAGMN